MKYSVIIPLFNEEENFDELYQRVRRTMDGLEVSYEIIFVDDGSADSTFAMITSKAKDDHRVVCVKLSRNFGQDNAILAGMGCSRGEDIVLMDGDLQDPPEIISLLIEEKSKGYGVVYGIKSHRKESFIKKTLTSLFYELIFFLSKVQIPRHAGTFSVFSRTVARNIVSLRENNKFVPGLRSFVGFRQTGVVYNREKRPKGKAKSYYDLIRTGLNAIFSFSIFPLRITMIVTLVMGGFTLAVIFLALSQHFNSQFAEFDMTDLLVFCVLFQLFLLLFALTIVCEYIGRIHEHMKRRPDYIIELIIREGYVIEDFEEIKVREKSLGTV